MRIGVGYPASARLDHARADFDAIAASGASIVFIGASEEDALQRSAHLVELVREARRRSLEVRVSPRGVLGLFAGGGASLAIGRDPSIRQRLSDGTLVPAACPNVPAAGEWLDRWLDAVVASRPDGIAWLEPRLWIALRDPWNAARRDAWACACDACTDAWSHGRHDAPGGAMPTAFTAEVRAFRRRSLVGLLEPSLARAHRDGLRNDVTVSPAIGEEPTALPWDDLAAMPYLSGLGSDACDGIDARAADEAAFRASRLARAARGRVATHVRFCLDGIRAGREALLAGAVEAAAAAGADEVLVREWPDAESAEPRVAATDAAAAIPAVVAWRILVETALP